MKEHEIYMQRCFDLARLGARHVAPNPMVGAVLVYDGRIIGEGWHRKYGQAHAEVNAVGDVAPVDRHLIKNSTLYVSLEPCCTLGNTPPCTDLIIKNKIKKVVISCVDKTPAVKGKGVAVLEQAGVKVVQGILSGEGKAISTIRNTFTNLRRPYILLKFAKTRNGYMGKRGRQVWISNLFSKRLAHKARSEYGAILIGTNTATTDSPQLNNRLWTGDSPLRIVLDRNLKISKQNAVLNQQATTWVVTEQDVEDNQGSHIQYKQINFDDSLIENILAKLVAEGVTSLIVEGGSYTLTEFIKKDLWDLAWTFTGKRMIENGIPAPFINGEVVEEWPLADDLLTIYQNKNPQPLNFH